MEISEKTVIWFSRLLRWGLGVFFMATGIYFYDSGGWPAIIFGAVLFVTGFFRPVRCLDDTCNLK
jgi:hypothetical protein